MPSVADALRAHVPAYLQKYGEAVPLGHRKVLSAITRCRTGELGGVLYECNRCGREHWVGRSCGNRHCPNCQKAKTQLWLAKQSSRLLPVDHFLVTFTVPSELRFVLRANQRDGYAALFSAAADSIRDVAAATRSLQGCALGYFGVLHTWGRDPTVYHPHVHFVVPAGGVQVDDGGNAIAWQACAKNFFVHHDTLAGVYKAKLADNLRECGLYDKVDTSAWRGKSVVDIRGVGDGRAVLKYLAPYIYRVAISDNRIVSVDQRSVTYKVRPSKSESYQLRSVSGEQFVRSFSQHVLPRGFQKVRYYGWLSPAAKLSHEEVRLLVWLHLGWVYWLASAHKPQQGVEREPVLCAACGSEMKLIGVTYSDSRALVQHSVAYLDSG